MRRFDLERAVLAARLPGPQVAIMLTLCTRIYADEGLIPSHQQPSLNHLAAATGYSRSTVMRHLNQLEPAGWVTRIRPPRWLSQRHHVTTAYAMHIPPGYQQARSNGHLDLGALSGEARRLAIEALVARDDQARRAATGELGPGGPEPGATARHRPDKTESRPAAALACLHGVPGGDELHPRTGKPRCPMCRVEAV
jgi:DNA-binding transcriptional MocR family regulator